MSLFTCVRETLKQTLIQYVQKDGHKRSRGLGKQTLMRRIEQHAHEEGMKGYVVYSHILEMTVSSVCVCDMT